MTQDDVIEMAEQSNLLDVIDSFHYDTKNWVEEATAFAKLVAAKEREACAKVCESIYTNGDGAECWLENAASKIRARGEQA
jgi:hypothetical protein